MKEPRPALENLCCLNVQCNAYGQRGQANLKVRKIYGVDRIRYLRCGCCGEEFSERKGTALFNCKISEAQAVSVMEHLDSGCGLNATARLVGVSKDAVGRLLRVGGRISYQLHDRLVRNLQPAALQFDEKWSYVAKKQRHVTAQDDPSQTGDYWDANSLDPQSKLLVSLVPGRRTTHTIHQVVADAAQRLAAQAGLPALFTDGEPTYPEAIVTTFGRAYPVPRRSTPRPTPGPGGADPPRLGICPSGQTSARQAGSTGGSPTDLWQGQIGSGRGRLGLDESQHQRHRAVQPDRSDAQRAQNPQDAGLFAANRSA